MRNCVLLLIFIGLLGCKTSQNHSYMKASQSGSLLTFEQMWEKLKFFENQKYIITYGYVSKSGDSNYSDDHHDAFPIQHEIIIEPHLLSYMLEKKIRFKGIGNQLVFYGRNWVHPANNSNKSPNKVIALELDEKIHSVYLSVGEKSSIDNEYNVVLTLVKRAKANLIFPAFREPNAPLEYYYINPIPQDQEKELNDKFAIAQSEYAKINSNNQNKILKQFKELYVSNNKLHGDDKVNLFFKSDVISDHILCTNEAEKPKDVLSAYFIQSENGNWIGLYKTDSWIKKWSEINQYDEVFKSTKLIFLKNKNTQDKSFVISAGGVGFMDNLVDSQITKSTAIFKLPKSQKLKIANNESVSIDDLIHNMGGVCKGQSTCLTCNYVNHFYFMFEDQDKSDIEDQLIKLRAASNEKVPFYASKLLNEIINSKEDYYRIDSVKPTIEPDKTKTLTTQPAKGVGTAEISVDNNVQTYKCPSCGNPLHTDHTLEDGDVITCEYCKNDIIIKHKK